MTRPSEQREFMSDLGDYKLALLYYQRTYQWDPETSYPARFKAAFILDRQFHQRDEALKLYQEALQLITKSQRAPPMAAICRSSGSRS